MIVPHLPPISDLALIIDLWANTDGLERDRPRAKGNRGVKNSHRPHQSDRWTTLEGKGDAYAHFLAHNELPKILGENNHQLLRIVIDHAKSNDLFAQISRTYKLDKWVKNRPMGNNKQWANVFEVFIACAALDRQLYDDSDYLADIRFFLIRLWSIRYRRLSQYFMRPIFDTLSSVPSKLHAHPNATSITVDSIEQIDYPSHPIFADVLGSLVNGKGRPTLRCVGWLATVTITSPDEAERTHTYNAFSSVNEAEAIEMAKLRCSIPNSTCQSNILISPESVYDKIRREIFMEMTSFLDQVPAMAKKESKHPKHLAEKMGRYLDTYLGSTSDTTIMPIIQWQKVLLPFAAFHYPSSSLSVLSCPLFLYRCNLNA